MISFILIPLIQVTAWDSTKIWTSQADSCNAVLGNQEQELDNVYLGQGSTVPSAILQQYPQASAGYLEAWKTAMVNMTIKEFKSFVIPAAQGYTTPGSQLYDKDLFFEVTITAILNDNGTHITDRNSVVNVIYSLYTDCRTKTTTSTTTLTSSSTVTQTLPTNQSSISSPTSSVSNTIKTIVQTTSGEAALMTFLGLIYLIVIRKRKKTLK